MGDLSSSSSRPPYSPSYVPSTASYFPHHSYTLPARTSSCSLSSTPLRATHTAPDHPAQSHPVKGKDNRDGISAAPLYTCTLCRRPIESNQKPYFISERSGPSTVSLVGEHTLCEGCWTWAYNLAICWTCGEVVSRGEERVSFGWCWWHWGCLACLICRVSCAPCSSGD